MYNKLSRGDQTSHYTSTRRTSARSEDSHSPFQSDPLGGPAPWTRAERRPIQRRKDAASSGPASTPEAVAPPTSLPGDLRNGMELLSGMSLGDVRVHYDSPQPSRIQALAYTQGDDIYIGPGQEQHLPHEAWHVVQQRQGRVPIPDVSSGQPINYDAALESEADEMAQRALAMDSDDRPDQGDRGNREGDDS